MKRTLINAKDQELLDAWKSNLHKGITSHQSSKNLQTVNAGEGVEKREPFYTVGGNVNWCSHYGEEYEGSLQN